MGNGGGRERARGDGTYNDETPCVLGEWRAAGKSYYGFLLLLEGLASAVCVCIEL